MSFVRGAGPQPNLCCDFPDCLVTFAVAGEFREVRVRGAVEFLNKWGRVGERDFCPKHFPIARQASEMSQAPARNVQDVIDACTLQTILVTCDHDPICAATVVLVGDRKAALLLGWGVDADETRIFCPTHHPLGLGQVLAQVAATNLFLRIGDACDDTDADFRPEVLATMHRLREMLEGAPVAPGGNPQ